MQNQTLDLTRIESRLQRIYGASPTESEKVSSAKGLISEVLKKFTAKFAAANSNHKSSWDEQDVVLITYGDQVQPDADQGQTNSLSTLRRFLSEHNLFDVLNNVHFLPCFPYSSDDGFSVIDYRQIDPDLGSWDDVAAFRDHGHVMLDFVVNHVSQHSEWFKNYLQNKPPYNEFFIEVAPDTDVSGVTRPRSLPLLSDFETVDGTRWLWTTFSRDQLDLNYGSPRLLAEVIDILLLYVSHGARIIRLDAIAYLWKEIGTSCIHLPQTHEVVKLLRDVLEMVAPHVLLLSETNVPHKENVSYFGDGDEAHMVYQFSLPPLLLDAFLNEDALPLKRWLSELESPPAGATYFNFTASHDGVGVRPLEGQVSNERLNSLVEAVRQRGARVGTRRNPDGSDSPYELNVSYVDALGPAAKELSIEEHAQRFLASQTVMLSLQGMPAVYFHSLVGSQNDVEAAERSGIPRRINRRKFTITELNARLNEDNLHRLIFEGMQRLLQIRTQQPAFHPDAAQQYLESSSDHVLCFERQSHSGSQRILVAANFHNETVTIDLPAEYAKATDLIAGNTFDQQLALEPSQVVWLVP